MAAPTITDVFVVLPKVQGALSYAYLRGANLGTITDVTVNVTSFGGAAPCHFTIPKGSTTQVIVLLLYDVISLLPGFPRGSRAYGTGEVPITITVTDSGSGQSGQ